MEQVSKQSVTLGNTERLIVGHLAKSKGISFSAALRIVVREWNEIQKIDIQQIELEQSHAS